MIAGGSILLYDLKGRYPFLFTDAERSMVPVGMIIKPTAAVAAPYFVKIIYDRWIRTKGKVKESNTAL
jgi:hypothetical protein